MPRMIWMVRYRFCCSSLARSPANSVLWSTTLRFSCASRSSGLRKSNVSVPSSWASVSISASSGRASSVTVEKLFSSSGCAPVPAVSRPVASTTTFCSRVMVRSCCDSGSRKLPITST